MGITDGHVGFGSRKEKINLQVLGGAPQDPLTRCAVDGKFWKKKYTEEHCVLSRQKDKDYL